MTGEFGDGDGIVIVVFLVVFGRFVLWRDMIWQCHILIT